MAAELERLAEERLGPFERARFKDALQAMATRGRREYIELALARYRDREVLVALDATELLWVARNGLRWSIPLGEPLYVEGKRGLVFGTLRVRQGESEHLTMV